MTIEVVDEGGLGKKVHFSDKPTKELSTSACALLPTVAMPANETSFLGF